MLRVFFPICPLTTAPFMCFVYLCVAWKCNRLPTVGRDWWGREGSVVKICVSSTERLLDPTLSLTEISIMGRNPWNESALCLWKYFPTLPFLPPAMPEVRPKFSPKVSGNLVNKIPWTWMDGKRRHSLKSSFLLLSPLLNQHKEETGTILSSFLSLLHPLWFVTFGPWDCPNLHNVLCGWGRQSQRSTYRRGMWDRSFTRPSCCTGSSLRQNIDLLMFK